MMSKLSDDLKVKEAKLPIVNQQCIVHQNYLNVTCAMQYMLAIPLGTYMSEWVDTKKVIIHLQTLAP